MAKPNYSFEKRKKEIERKRKKEEKVKKKTERDVTAAPDETDESPMQG